MNEQHIESAWWSLDIPGDWTAHQENECFTFEPPDQSCAVQVSAHRKDNEPVSDDDLRDFAREHIEAGARPVASSFGPFTGFSIGFRTGDMAHRYWWLRHESLLVFATLITEPSQREHHEPAIARILQTLTPTGGA